MKHIFLLLLLFSSISSKINASIIDTVSIEGEPDYNYEYVLGIIEKEHLKDSLTNNSWCSLCFQNLYTISVKQDDSYVLYYGFIIDGGEMKRKVIPVDDAAFSRVFMFDSNSIKETISINHEYAHNPWFFILIDSLNNKKFEWEHNYICHDKYADTVLSFIGDYYARLINIIFERELQKLKDDRSRQHSKKQRAQHEWRIRTR